MRRRRDDFFARTRDRSHTCRASDSCYRVRLGQSSFTQAERENPLEDYSEGILNRETVSPGEEKLLPRFACADELSRRHPDKGGRIHCLVRHGLCVIPLLGPVRPFAMV